MVSIVRLLAILCYTDIIGAKYLHIYVHNLCIDRRCVSKVGMLNQQSGKACSL